MRFNFSIGILLALFVCNSAALINAAMLSADEILAKALQAMGVASHYKIVGRGMQMSIYQKPLPDGSMAMLTDVSEPIKQTTINYGEKSYILYLDKKLRLIQTYFLQEQRTCRSFLPYCPLLKILNLM